MFLLLSVLLFLIAETVGDWLVGASCVFLFTGLSLIWVLPFPTYRKRVVGAISCCLIVATGGLSFAYHLSPTDRTVSGNFSQIYQNNTAFKRMSITNLVPEIDQLKLGTYFLPLSDPVIDGKQAVNIRQLFVKVYNDLRQDSSFIQVGSSLGQCYEELLQGQRQLLHFYQYIPKHLNKKSYPVVVFVHGSLGNFKGYIWNLKSFADSKGFAIIAPSFGCGNWQLDAKSQILHKIYEYCVRETQLDHHSLYIMGISNGGMGVTREIQNHGDRYQGFALISPVMEIDVVTDPDFIQQLKGKPLLLIHGQNDKRIPMDYVSLRESIFKKSGALVSSNYYPEEDHFLFFSKPQSIVNNIIDWLDIMH